MALRSRWVGVVALSGLTMLAAACGGSALDGAAPPALPTSTSSAASGGETAGALSFTGNVVAKQQVSIVPKVAGRVTKLLVDVGSEVKAGDVLLELDKDALEAQAAQAQGALAAAQSKLAGMEAGPRAEQVAQAQASLDVATQKLNALQKGPRSEIVAQAAANVRAAEAKLQQLKDGPTADQRRAAMEAVEGAKVALNSANVKKDGDCAGGPYHSDYQCKSSQAAAEAAAHGVDAAQALYDALVAPPTEQQLAQAQAALDAAREQFALAQNPYTTQDIKQAEGGVQIAQQQLKLAKNPFTTQDLDGMRAQVAQAKAAVDLAKLQLGEATLRAPFNGIVAQRFVSEGAMAGPTAPLLSLISRETEVAVGVDEVSLAALQNGMPATVTSGAYPGVEFTAKVTSIAPSVDAKTRTAQVRLAAIDPDGKLRDGMLASVKILRDGK